MKRVFEPEVMESMDEALAYDRMIKLYGFWIDSPFVRKISGIIKRRVKKERFSLLDIGCGTGGIPIGIAKSESKGSGLHISHLTLYILSVTILSWPVR